MIKLTKKILDSFEEYVLDDDSFYVGNFIRYSKRDLGKKITWEMMRKRMEYLEKRTKYLEDRAVCERCQGDCTHGIWD